MNLAAAWLIAALAAGSDIPTVVVFATVGEEAPPLRQAFSEALENVLRQRFLERRWAVLRADESARAVMVACETKSCENEAARRLGAERWIESSIRSLEGHGCELRVALHRVDNPKPLRSLTSLVRPCAVDGLMTRAEYLGSILAAGPREDDPVSIKLSNLPFPDLHIANVRDVAHRAVRTSTARAFSSDRALATYRRTAVRVFRDDAGRLRFVQNGRLLDECALRRAVGAPISRDIRVFCRGNAWGWALLGVPAGGLLAWANLPSLEEGSQLGFVGFSFGVITAVTAGALALGLMKSGHSPESGEYHSSPQELRRLAAEANRRLRASLDLTRAELDAFR